MTTLERLQQDGEAYFDTTLPNSRLVQLRADVTDDGTLFLQLWHVVYDGGKPSYQEWQRDYPFEPTIEGLATAFDRERHRLEHINPN